MLARLHPIASQTTLLAAALLLSATAFAAAPSTEFQVTGAVNVPTSYDLDTLSALPAITQTVSYGSGSGTQTHTYIGTSVWGLLDGAGIVVNPNIKNDVLNKYVLATGYVSNLVDLDVRSSGSTQTGTGGGMSTQFSVTGAVLNAQSFDLAGLQALTSITETFGGHTYVGVSFWDLLNTTVGINLNANIKNDVLGKYVVATGSDGYKALFSLGELDTAFGNQPDMIAYEVDGVSLGSSGFARVVVPNDVKMGRWVSNLVSLEVFSASAVPEPASWALLLAGLAVMGVAARRNGKTLLHPNA